MKKLLFPLLAVVIIGTAIGGYFYYQHNYVEVVTDRYLVTVTPQGDSSPKVNVTKTRDYSSDSVAVERETQEARSHAEQLANRYQADLKKHANDDKIMRRALATAYEHLFGETRTLVIFQHTRNLDVQEAVKVIKKHGLASDEVKRYVENNHLQIEIIPIS